MLLRCVLTRAVQTLLLRMTGLLARTAEAKERRVKERLDDYNRRNFGARARRPRLRCAAC